MTKAKDLFKGVPVLLYKSDDEGYALGVVLVDSNGNFYDANTISNIGYVSGTSEGIDAYTQSLIIVQQAHHEIHEGDHYHVSGFDVLADTQSTVFTMITPDTTKWVHLVFDVESTGETYFGIFEGGTITATGTVVTPVNNNRNSSNTSAVRLYKNSTIGSSGTSLGQHLFGVASNPATSMGGGIGREDELILKQNTLYHFIFVSNSNGNNVDYLGLWYEHTPKNG